MRSFRDFLREEDPCWKGYKQVGMKKKGKRKVPNCVPVNEAWKYSEKTHQTYSGPETVKQHTHTTTIDGKKVEVGFGHNVGYHDEGTWDVHFAVNHDMEAPRNTHPSTAKKILKHVGNVTKSFIQKHNPKELTWSATDLDKEQSEKKGRIYKALARKHGAKIKEKGLKNIFGGGEASLKLREEWASKNFTSGSQRRWHSTTLPNGRKVGVDFHHDPDIHDEGEFNMGFHVDGGVSAGRKATPKEAREVLSHVKKITQEFVAKHKPKKLSWTPYDADPKQVEAKRRIYNHLAKKQGLKVGKFYDDMENDEVNYVKIKEEWSYEKKHRPAFNMTSHFAHHDAEIDGHKVRTTFVNSTHSPKQHTVSFTVDGNLSAEKGKAHKASTAKKIIQHVRGITKEYIAKHNPHEINFSGMDEDPKKQKVKNVIYQRLAKKAGAKITSKDTGEFVQNRIKLREGRDNHEHRFHETIRDHGHLDSSQPGRIDLYHEAPGHVKASIEKNGFNRDQFDDGIFGTIGQHSGFVTSKKKTIVHMRIPTHQVKKFQPDMPYGNRADSKSTDPHEDFVKLHGKYGKGGDVFFNHPNPEKFIHKITEVG